MVLGHLSIFGDWLQTLMFLDSWKSMTPLGEMFLSLVTPRDLGKVPKLYILKHMQQNWNLEGGNCWRLQSPGKG